MGQAFDRDGNVLGEAFGDTKREVLDQLERMHPTAEEVRIKSFQTAQKPSVGRVVHYVPKADDPPHNNAKVLPAMIVNVWSDSCVNLRVINDEVYDFWVTSATQGTGPRQWDWPPRV